MSTLAFEYQKWQKYMLAKVQSQFLIEWNKNDLEWVDTVKKIINESDSIRLKNLARAFKLGH